MDGGDRVISVSSRVHKASAIQWGDLQFDRGYDKWKAYGQTAELTGVDAFASA